jgi:hypothetical protein
MKFAKRRRQQPSLRLFMQKNGQGWLGADFDPAAAPKTAADQNAEIRIRALACDWLRAHKQTASPHALLGGISSFFAEFA